jgi:glutamyl-tRNA synthetase
MSKREAAEAIKDGYSIFLKDMEGLGYTPEAVCNWIALMGWSYDDHTEFFLIGDMVEKFELKKLNPSPAAINFTKLDYFNGLHIRNLTDEELASRLIPFFKNKRFNLQIDRLLRIAPIIKERLVTLDDALDFAGFFFQVTIDPNPQELLVKGLSPIETATLAKQILEILQNSADISSRNIEPVMRAFVEKEGLNPGQVFGLMRVAITGQKVSPPLFESMEIIGKDVVISRVKNAIRILASMN